MSTLPEALPPETYNPPPPHTHTNLFLSQSQFKLCFSVTCNSHRRDWRGLSKTAGSQWAEPVSLIFVPHTVLDMNGCSRWTDQRNYENRILNSLLPCTPHIWITMPSPLFITTYLSRGCPHQPLSWPRCLQPPSNPSCTRLPGWSCQIYLQPSRSAHCYRPTSNLLTLLTRPTNIHPCHRSSLASHHML